LPARGEASLKVFGPDGRLARTLVSGDLDAGTHVLTWDRADDAERRLPARVY
jgi:hypothetical protein